MALQVGCLQLQAPGVSYQTVYSAQGKAMYTGKDLTEVHHPQRDNLCRTQ